MSTQLLTLENEARVSFSVVAPTVITCNRRGRKDGNDMRILDDFFFFFWGGGDFFSSENIVKRTLATKLNHS